MNGTFGSFRDLVPRLDTFDMRVKVEVIAFRKDRGSRRRRSTWAMEYLANHYRQVQTRNQAVKMC